MRVKPGSCETHPALEALFDTCYSDFSSSTEEKNPMTPAKATLLTDSA